MKTTHLYTLLLSLTFLFIGLVSADYGFENPSIPHLNQIVTTTSTATTNTSSNNTIYWDGHSFVFGAVSSIESDPIWNANYSLVLKTTNLPLANRTTPNCANITGSSANLCLNQTLNAISIGGTLGNSTYLKLDGSNSPSANIGWNNKPITNLNSLTFSGGSSITQSGLDLFLQGDTAVDFGSNLYAPAGFANSPAYSAVGLGGHGMWFNSTGVGISDSGTQVAFFDSSITRITATQTYFSTGSASTPGIAFSAAGGNGITVNTTGTIITDLGTAILFVDGTQSRFFSPLRANSFIDNGGTLPASTVIVTTNGVQQITAQKNFTGGLTTKNINMDTLNGNLTAHDINASGVVSSTQGYISNNAVGLTQGMTIMKTAITSCDLNFTGGILTATTC